MPEQIPHFRGGGELLSLDQRPKKIAKDEPRGIRRFRAVKRGLASDTLAPADDAVYIRLYQQNAAHFRAVHAGFERCHQFHSHFLQCDLAYSHDFSAAVPFLEVAPRSRSGGSSDPFFFPPLEVTPGREEIRPVSRRGA